MKIHRVIGMLVLVCSLAAGWLWSDYRQFLETPLHLPAQGLVYQLPRGGSAASLGHDLAKRGILGNHWYFRLFARHNGAANRLQAGEYLIAQGTTPVGLVELLSSGQVIQYPVTLLEGWTFRQLTAALRDSEFLRVTIDGLSDQQVMQRLGRPELHPEGRFLPDTYHFPRAASDLQVLQRALQAMDGTLAAEWEKREQGLPLNSPDEALVLASIVEKETGQAAERPEIAGVFVRRLRKGMKLQTDPTVIYGLGEGFDGNLRRRDLRRDTPYNTYTRKGLPPTPIAMPGRAAIHAALHPAAGNSLYFVAKGDGSHQFSASLKAHNKAVRKYQLKK